MVDNPHSTEFEAIRAGIAYLDGSLVDRLRALGGFGATFAERAQARSEFESCPDYRSARTAYVRKMIRKISWEDREHIHDLFEIEHIILSSPTGHAHAIHFNRKTDRLRNQYPEAYLAILEELKPGQAADIRRREKRIDALRDEHARQREDLVARLEAAAYALWREAGGAD
jgi:hypothetical protein